MTHADLESLLRYADGELTPDRRDAVQAHLDVCEICRLTVHRLAVPKNHRPAPEEGPDLLSGVLESIQRWTAAEARPDLSCSAVRRRVAAELSMFLGPQATEKILQSVAEDNSNLLTVAEPILSFFLGTRAASRLAARIIDDAIVRVY